MRKFEAITQKAAGLVRKHDTRDPFQLARELGIHVEYADYFGKLKGMYMVVRRNRFIYLNNKLDERTLRIVCTHEIGHDQWHRDLAAAGAFREFMLYNMPTRQEYEANIFAAEVLLETDEVLRLIYEDDYDIVQIANAMNSDINLVALKVAHLRNLGYQLTLFEHRSDFLKKY